MKKIFFLSILGVSSFLSDVHAQYYPSNSRSQSELEILEELARNVEKDREKEANAQRQIYAYRENVLTEIRRYSGQLSLNDYNELINFEHRLWRSIQESIRYSRNYTEFYRTGYGLLESYKNQILNTLYRKLK